MLKTNIIYNSYATLFQYALFFLRVRHHNFFFASLHFITHHPPCTTRASTTIHMAAPSAPAVPAPLPTDAENGIYAPFNRLFQDAVFGATDVMVKMNYDKEPHKEYVPLVMSGALIGHFKLSFNVSYEAFCQYKMRSRKHLPSESGKGIEIPKPYSPDAGNTSIMVYPTVGIALRRLQVDPAVISSSLCQKKIFGEGDNRHERLRLLGSIVLDDKTKTETRVLVGAGWNGVKGISYKPDAIIGNRTVETIRRGSEHGHTVLHCETMPKNKFKHANPKSEALKWSNFFVKCEFPKAHNNRGPASGDIGVFTVNIPVIDFWKREEMKHLAEKVAQLDTTSIGLNM